MILELDFSFNPNSDTHALTQDETTEKSIEKEQRCNYCNK